MPKDLQKMRISLQISRQNSVCSGLKFLSESKLFGGCHPCSRATSATLMSALRFLPVNKLHRLSRWLKTPINRYESLFTNSIYILHSMYIQECLFLSAKTTKMSHSNHFLRVLSEKCAPSLGYGEKSGFNSN